MVNSELDTFLQKFKQLWYSGLDADLNLHTHAGQAWVGLRVRLGHAPGPLHQPPNFPEQRKPKNGPSRQRRRSRRAASRQDRELAEQAENNINVNDSKEVVDGLEKDTSEKVTEVGEDLNDDLEKETSRNETELSEDLNINKPVENTVDQMEVISNAAIDSLKEPVVNSEDRTTPDTLENHRDTIEDSVNIAQIPPIVIVYATAMIEDSPYVTLVAEELDSLSRFIASKEHLLRNIADVEFVHLSSRELRSKYKHTVEVKIHVRTANLWEGARKYVWKHLGDDTWTRTNGTKMNLVRIHQK